MSEQESSDQGMSYYVHYKGNSVFPTSEQMADALIDMAEKLFPESSTLTVRVARQCDMGQVVIAQSEKTWERKMGTVHEPHPSDPRPVDASWADIKIPPVTPQQRGRFNLSNLGG